MDQLSQALTTLRVGRGTVRRFRQSGPWGLGYGGLTGSGFHVILSGSAWLLSATQPATRLGPGDVVLVTSGADHGLSSDRRPLAELPPVHLGPARPAEGPADFEFLCGAYRLERGPVHPYLASLPELIVLRSAQSSVTALLDQHESSGRLVTDTARHALLDLVLTETLTDWLRTSDPAPTADPVITGILRAIDDAPDTRWSVQELSQAAAMSRATFTRRFTQAVGQAPSTYLLSHRLQRAARLLRETDASLATIARQSGYATEFAFAGAFRRHYGLAPGRFRHAHRH